uniref:Uncharacterized protein n=1 Tax=Anguilla anguilla TaxID=7936 RepID=A0A0E9PI31_ANGAN
MCCVFRSQKASQVIVNSGSVLLWSPPAST